MLKHGEELSKYPDWVQPLFDEKVCCDKCGHLFSDFDITEVGISDPTYWDEGEANQIGYLSAFCQDCCSHKFIHSAAVDLDQIIAAIRAFNEILQLRYHTGRSSKMDLGEEYS